LGIGARKKENAIAPSKQSKEPIHGSFVITGLSAASMMS
jgi:hypothetical protein